VLGGQKMRHKFNAKPTLFNDTRYASKLEAKYAQRLNTAKEKGELMFWIEQVPFKLGSQIKYIVDFVEFWADGEIVVTEVKGFETPEWKIKYKLFEETYPITLNIVKK
jgi:uncharacterized protein DUF1064